jgi:hypothetical protein
MATRTTQPCSPDQCRGKQFKARKWRHSNPQTQKTFQMIKMK